MWLEGRNNRESCLMTPMALNGASLQLVHDANGISPAEPPFPYRTDCQSVAYILYLTRLIPNFVDVTPNVFANRSERAVRKGVKRSVFDSWIVVESLIR